MAKKLQGRTPTRTLQVATRELSSVEVSSDGSWLVTGGWDGSWAWDFATGAVVRHYEATPNKAVNWATRISPDGTRVVAGYGNLTLSFYEASTGRVVREHAAMDGIITSVSMAADGKHVLTGQPQQKIVLWDLATGDSLKVLKAKRSYCWKVALGPDAGLAVSASGPDKLVHVWDLQAGQEVAALAGHEKTIECLAFSGDGETVVSGSKDKTARLWKVSSSTPTMAHVLTGPRKAISDVAFSPDGVNVAASSIDGFVYLWRVSDGALVDTLEAGEPVPAVAFAPNGCVVGGGRGKAHVWVP